MEHLPLFHRPLAHREGHGIWDCRAQVARCAQDKEGGTGVGQGQRLMDSQVLPG